MSDSTQAPFLLPAHAEASRGVDFLGLRAINLQMMDELLPGMNNVADRVRPFSLLAWTIWVYEEHYRGSVAGMKASEYAQFREKVEVLFIFSQRVKGLAVSGIAGADQRMEHRLTTSLRFEDMGRSQSTTIISALNYGPGLKGDNGYAIAYPSDNVSGVFFVTKAGETMAKALDAQLRAELADQHYTFLRKIDKVKLATSDVEAFAQAWRLDALRPDETSAFWHRMYPAASTRIQEQSRVATIDLISAVLERESAPMSVSDIRFAMTSAPLHALPAAVDQTRWRWRALQLRQAQRLCMEVLFGALERYIWQHGAHSSHAFAVAMSAAIARAQPSWQSESLLAARSAHYRAKAGNADALFACAMHDPQCDVVGRAQTLAGAVRALTLADDTICEALDLLVLVAVHVEHMMATPGLSKYVVHPAPSRLPLAWWAAYFRERCAWPARDFLESLIENCLVSQHLGVAASRTRADSTRMRLSIDDVGIGSLLLGEDQCWRPRLTRDRLETCLSLMFECGKIARAIGEEGEYQYRQLGV
ncbi:hypothetical protein [Duganella vulcania]|uniref:Uncharacterized protein n=1 Tax=Duganella vulcania TaxID=2692166 RepID=A0A845GI85_9BURK|nr:hypothetical protein [Duganella vulcania]MYM92379.1 hypothetical protein [Duganella vulcania]